MNEVDSALMVFQSGIKLAEKKKDKNEESLLMQNISLAYSQKQEYKQALRAIQYSFQLNTDSAEILRYYVNFGKLYTFMGMLHQQLIRRVFKRMPQTPGIRYC